MSDNRGIDPDLIDCLSFHPQAFTVDNIDKVLAVYSSINGRWRWIIQVSDQLFYLSANGVNEWGGNEIVTLEHYTPDVEPGGGGIFDIHIENIIKTSLRCQLEYGKNRTSREYLER